MVLTLAIVAAGLIVAGMVFTGGDILEALGVSLRTEDPDHFQLDLNSSDPDATLLPPVRQE